MKKSFSIHSDYYEELCVLTDEQRGNIFLAFLNYSMDKEIPELDPICAMLFRIMKAQMERISSVNSANGVKSAEAKKQRRQNQQNLQQNQQNQQDLTTRNEINEINESNESNEINGAQRNQPTVSVTVTDTVTVSETVTSESTPLPPKGGPALAPAPNPAKIKYAELVHMTSDEYASLVTKLGEDKALRCIEILDNYKGSSGKKYVSDYKTILNWVVNRIEEEENKKTLNKNTQNQENIENIHDRSYKHVELSEQERERQRKIRENGGQDYSIFLQPRFKPAFEGACGG